MLHLVLEALFTCATSKNSYIVGSISVVIFTLSYYLAFPPVVRDRCLHYSNPQDPSLSHRPHYDVIVPYNSSWITEKSPQFQMTSDGNDVLVFLHMQKTGGTQVDQYLTHHVKGAPCNCKGHKSCVCNRPSKSSSKDDEEDYGENDAQYNTWLYSRSSTYRASCGVHADWTELTNCVPKLLDEEEKPNSKRRFFYFTILREPVGRFISEWRHVKRGATWKTSKYICNHQQYDIPLCYNGSDWSGVSIEDFLSCPYNLAFNRQTRMLADLSLVNCYNFSWSPLFNPNVKNPKLLQNHMTKLELEAKLVQSAKSNLLRMASFGLLSQYQDTQKLLGAALGLEFEKDLLSRRTHSEKAVFEPDVLKRIEDVNKLDLELFEFATQIFEQRIETLKSSSSIL